VLPVVAVSPDPIGCEPIVPPGLVWAITPVANDRASKDTDMMMVFRTDKSPWGQIRSDLDRVPTMAVGCRVTSRVLGVQHDILTNAI